MAAVDDAHRLAQAQVQSRVGDAVLGLLATITPERSPEIREQYGLAITRVVGGGQRAAATLAAAYMRAYLPPVEPVDLEGALAALAASAASKRYSGLLRMWRLQDEGAEEAAAREEAGAYARNLAEGDVHAAQRAGLDAAAEATRQTVRWRKVAGPNACDWCQAIAGGPTPARYFSAASVPIHTGIRFGRPWGGMCRCGVAPEIVEERLTRGGWQIRQSQRQQLSEQPAVRPHPAAEETRRQAR